MFLFDSEKLQEINVCFVISHLKFLELFLGSSGLSDFEDIEPHGLAERSALSNSDNISN